MRARATPVDETKYCKFANVVHIAVSESSGLSLVAKSPGGKVGINLDFRWKVRICTISSVISSGNFR